MTMPEHYTMAVGGARCGKYVLLFVGLGPIDAGDRNAPARARGRLYGSARPDDE